MVPGASLDGPVPSCSAGAAAADEVDGEDDVDAGRAEGEQPFAKARRSGELEAKAPDKCAIGLSDQRREKRASTNGTLKSSLKDRFKRLELAQQHRVKHKTDRSKEVKRRNFNSLPQVEADAFRKAFAQYDVDGSGQLDEREAIACLRELGLNGNNPDERREILQICAECTPEFVAFFEQDEAQRQRVAIDLLDFALEVVPSVRQMLNHKRSDNMLTAFFKFDRDGTGTLAGSEAMEIARGMGIDQRMIMELQSRQSTVGIVPTGQADVDFHSLQDLIAKGREKRDRVIRDRERNVKKFTGITDQLFEDFRADLLTLHDIFIRYDTDGSGTLSHTEVMLMVKEFGLMPESSYEREEVKLILMNNDADGNGEFSFPEFLELIREIRFYLQDRCRGQQMAAFERYDRDKSGSMNHNEICHLLVDLHFVPRSQREQDELAQLIQDIDVDGSGTIDFSEFQCLCQRIDEKLKSMRYEEEIEFAMLRGFTEAQMRDFRWVFDSMDRDGSGKLELQEVKNGLVMLGKQNFAPEAFDSCWREVDADESGELDFFEFLQFMKLMRDGESIFCETKELLSKPCSLDTRVLRRVLESFRLSASYVRSMSKDELVVLFCDFFHIKAEQDMSDSLGVKSVGDLYDLAAKRDQELQKPAAAKQQTHRHAG